MIYVTQFKDGKITQSVFHEEESGPRESRTFHVAQMSRKCSAHKKDKLNSDLAFVLHRKWRPYLSTNE